jgi:hypothetical protein
MSTTKSVNVGLLGSNTMQTCRQIPVVWRKILPQSLELKLEARCSPETLVSTYKSTP